MPLFKGIVGNLMLKSTIFQMKSPKHRNSVESTFNHGFLIIVLFGNVNLILPHSYIIKRNK